MTKTTQATYCLTTLEAVEEKELLEMSSVPFSLTSQL